MISAKRGEGFTLPTETVGQTCWFAGRTANLGE